MATTLLNTSFVDPNSERVSVARLARSMGMAPPVSLRAMIERRDRVRVVRWGVCIATFTGARRATTLDNAALDRIFGDMDGVASLIRHASGGRAYIEWDIFGPLELMTFDKKKEFARQGTEIEEYRKSAQSMGIDLNRFDHIMWVIDEGVSEGGTTPSDSLTGAKTFSASLAAHEIMHSFGVCCHADSSSMDDYNNPYCLMGFSGARCSFQGSYLPAGYAAVGPGLTAPYLLVAGWLDLNRHTHRVTGDPGARLNEEFVLRANRGAPSLDVDERVAVTVGDLPNRKGDPAQYWVEFRRPTGFDRNVSVPAPQWAGAPVLLLHRVEVDPPLSPGQSRRCGGRLHSYLISAVPALVDSQSAAFGGYRFQVASTSADHRTATVRLVPA